VPTLIGILASVAGMTTELANVRSELEKLIGKQNVSDSFYKVSDYCMNHVARKVFAISKPAPFIVARPQTVDQVADVVKYAHRTSIPIFVRGGGSGYSGGEVPTTSSIALEMTGLDRIIEVDTKGGYVTCEAGITVQELNRRLQSEHGLWWPHDPGSREFATVAGALTGLGGGAYSTKFGYAPDGVTGLKIVTAEGEIVSLGSKVGHHWAQYDLIRTIASGEGTLAIIAETTIKIFPMPQQRLVGIALFGKFEDAVATCYNISAAGLHPESLMLEDVLRFKLESIGPFIDMNSPTVKKLGLESVEAVMIYSYGGSPNVVEELKELTDHVVESNGGRRVDDKQVVEAYWKSKTELPSWSKDLGKLKIHSFVPSIPLIRAPDLNRLYVRLGENPKLERIGARYYVILPYLECTVSPTVMLNEDDPEALKAYEAFTREFTDGVIKMQGSPVSTLGVGLRLVDTIESTSSEAQMRLMRRIKRGLDPTNLLNPGKKLRSS